MRVLTVIGARPQFIKAAPVGREFRARGIAEILVHTGQHFDDDMSRVFIDELGIAAPAYNLGVHGGGHGEMTGRMMQALEPVMRREAPEVVLVYGDTNSTLAGALCAAKLQLPVAHVEAGLRSDNRKMPEEINRVVTDHLSGLLFCPTRTAVGNLRREGIKAGVHHVGDVMYDAALDAAGRAAAGSRILDRLGVTAGGYQVATVHRPENTDDSAMLRRVLEYLDNAGEDCPLVFPLHPRTRRALPGGGAGTKHIRFCDPLGHLDMTQLIVHARRILTDSGGMQKEAYFHRVPCVTLRSETEWVETIEAGWNRLWQGPDYRPRHDIDDYGKGDAAAKIVAILRERHAS